MYGCGPQHYSGPPQCIAVAHSTIVTHLNVWLWPRHYSGPPQCMAVAHGTIVTHLNVWLWPRHYSDPPQCMAVAHGTIVAHLSQCIAVAHGTIVAHLNVLQWPTALYSDPPQCIAVVLLLPLPWLACPSPAWPSQSHHCYRPASGWGGGNRKWAETRSHFSGN